MFVINQIQENIWSELPMQRLQGHRKARQMANERKQRDENLMKLSELKNDKFQYALVYSKEGETMGIERLA